MFPSFLTSSLPCISQIVHIMRLHFSDLSLFKMALRALGNLSFCDENIRYLVDSGAVECIVQVLLRSSPLVCA